MGGGHRTDFCGELLERPARFVRERLAQYFTVLGFRRAAVFSGAQFEPGDEFLIEVADNQLSHKIIRLR